MPNFEEEAFARAQQMHRRNSFHNENSKKPVQQKEEKREVHQNVEEKCEEKLEQKPLNCVPQNSKSNENLIDALFKNKDQSIILLLIILLMDEKNDPVLLLALIYILM